MILERFIFYRLSTSINIGAATAQVQNYVELLIVTDQTTFELHKKFYQTSNTTVIYSYMLLYYAHFVKSVSYGYPNSIGLQCVPLKD